MSLKRPASFEGEGCSSLKLPRLGWHYVLEDESEQPTDEDSESVHSIQEKETDFAKDTSDTSTHSDWSDGVTMEVEYEVASLSEKENPLGDGSLSSDTDDVMCAAGVVVLCDEELSLFADSSGNSDSQFIIDPEVPRADYWTCVQCKNKNNNPLFRYCEKCYKRQKCVQCNRSKKLPCFSYCEVCHKVRKSFFPPRPCRRRRKRRMSNKKQASLMKTSSTASTVGFSDVSQENIISSGEINIAGPSNIHLDSGLGSSQESCYQTESKCNTDSQEISSNSSSGNSEVCITCMTNPKNGIFVHGKVGHICCCYKCALKVWTEARRCPLCNCRVSNVLKAIVQ